jgi:hypothetical protein
VKGFLEKVKNNRVFVLKIFGSFVSIAVVLGYVTVEEGAQISEAVVMGFGLIQLVGGIVLGIVQRSQAYGPETVKKERRKRYGH